MYRVCWLVHVLLVVASTLAWHCVVSSLYGITMPYICRRFVTTELVPL